MNKLQEKVFEYLTEPGHPERVKVLRYVMDPGTAPVDYSVLTNYGRMDTEDETRRKLKIFLDANPLSMCKEGIERARKALLDNPKRRIKVVLEIDHELDKPKDFGRSRGTTFRGLEERIGEFSKTGIYGTKNTYSNVRVLEWEEVERYQGLEE